MDDWKPTTEREKAQDHDAKIEAAWWQERRDRLPNLQAVIDAAQARLTDDEGLSSEGRDRLEVALVGMAHQQHALKEISESDRDELLRQIKAL